MALSEGNRLRFLQWLVENQLEEPVASAILDSMGPYDWHEQATKADISRLERATKADISRLERATKADIARLERTNKADITELTKEMDQRFAEVDKRFTEVDHRFDLMDARFDAIDQRFAGVDQRFLTMEEQMRSNQESINSRFNGLEHNMGSRFDSLSKDIRVLTLTMMGFLVALIMAIVGGGVTFLVS